MKSLGGNRRAVVAVTVWEHWLCCLGLVRKRRDFSSEEVSECVSVLLLLCFGVQGVMLGWVSVEDDEVLISVWPIKSLGFECYCLSHASFAARGEKPIAGRVSGPFLNLKSVNRAGLLIHSMPEGPEIVTMIGWPVKHGHFCFNK